MSDLLAQLNPQVQHILSALVQVAPQEARFWLVGGVVRDLLLGRDPGRDIDLAFEGVEIDELLPLLVNGLGATIEAQHEAFGTATIVVGDPPLLIDLARTRVERYAQPAVLPAVEPATLAEDLFRRDFTVNALALPIISNGTALQPAAIIDQYNGLDDLRHGLLRVIHPASFRDDPTRILRGVRLAARLGLTLEPTTSQVLAEALTAGYVWLLTPERIRNELCLALEEPKPEEVLRLSDAWGVSEQLFPGLHWSEQIGQRFDELRRQEAGGRRQEAGALISLKLPPASRLLVHAGMLVYDMDAAEREALVVRYRLPGAAANLLREISRAQVVLQEITSETAPGTLDRLLRPFSDMVLAVVHYAEQPPTSDIITMYLARIRPVATLLNGADLQQLGLRPGPMLGQVLAELRMVQLDNGWVSRGEAVAWVQARIAGGSNG
jgi:tRNA nucleotidyltransferase (CCA-adding enzyme)